MSHTTRKRRRKRRPQWFCAFKKREKYARRKERE